MKFGKPSLPTYDLSHKRVSNRYGQLEAKGNREDDSTDAGCLEENYGIGYMEMKPSLAQPEVAGRSPTLDGFEFLSQLAQAGFYAQFFASGMLGAGLYASRYGFFLGYLNVPAYVYTTVSTLCSLPHSFRFLFGAANDRIPICGMKRVPYMVLGWCICGFALLGLSVTPLPAPYWCVHPQSGSYIMQTELSDGGWGTAEPCNAEASKMAGRYTCLMMLATLGYVVSSVAAEGLMVQYAKLEPIKIRGRIQATSRIASALGMASANAFVGLCMNGKLYNGSFSWGLDFNQACTFFTAVALIMIFVSLLIREPSCFAGAVSAREYGAMSWKLLCGQAFFSVILYNMIHSVIGGVHTTAGPLVRKQWAGVQTLQNQMCNMVGMILFSGCLWMVREYCLDANWRLVILSTTVGTKLIDSLFVFLTVFGVVRSQYFFLGESLVLELPWAAMSLVTSFLMAEMADEGNEGFVYALLTSSSNLGWPVANAISNQVFRAFRPALSDIQNYIEDKPSFRVTVSLSYLTSYGFAIVALGGLYCLPSQKQEAQEWKTTWRRHWSFGAAIVMLISCGFCYGLSVNILAMFPSTMCLKYAGGNGCNATSGTANSANPTR